MAQPVNVGNRDPNPDPFPANNPAAKKPSSFEEAGNWAKRLVEEIRKDEKDAKAIFDVAVEGPAALIPLITALVVKLFPAANIPAEAIQMAARKLAKIAQEKVTAEHLEASSQKSADLKQKSKDGAHAVSAKVSSIKNSFGDKN